MVFMEMKVLLGSVCMSLFQIRQRAGLCKEGSQDKGEPEKP